MKEEAEEHRCVFFGEHNTKIEALEVIGKAIPKAHARMNMKINIGYGLFLAGALIVGIVFTQLESVEADIRTKQLKHEMVINEEQVELKGKIDTIEDKIGSIEVTTAVISTQLKDYQEDLREDRERTRESLRELKDLIKERSLLP